MKKVSLKIKLTLLYTIFILVVVGTVLGILFSLSGREILASTKMSLERRVEESLEEIEMQDGELKIRIFILWKTESIFPCMTQPDIFYMERFPGDSIGSRTFWMEK